MCTTSTGQNSAICQKYRRERAEVPHYVETLHDSVPTHSQSAERSVLEADLRVALGRKPTKAEMGKAVGMSELQVERCLTAMAQKCYSLDQELVNNKKPINSDNTRGTLIELVASSADDGEQERIDRFYMVQDLIETLHRHLPPDEVELLLLRFGLKESPRPEHRYRNKQLTIAELGAIVGQKPDKVRRTIKRSLKQLQAAGPEEWKEFQHALQ